MKEITKLDNKYIVVKIEDINQLLNMEERQSFAMLLMKVDGKRQQTGKPINDYVVLNLDDEIDLDDVIASCRKFQNEHGYDSMYNEHSIDSKVKDIAVDLVNAIIKAKKE